jgi:hypothetical protein
MNWIQRATIATLSVTVLCFFVNVLMTIAMTWKVPYPFSNFWTPVIGFVLVAALLWIWVFDILPKEKK